jgi:hypothetical protein
MAASASRSRWLAFFRAHPIRLYPVEATVVQCLLRPAAVAAEGVAVTAMDWTASTSSYSDID